MPNHPLYEISVAAEFCAAHALTISGVREATHGHNFRITARIRGQSLDADGLLCDFHTVEETLQGIIEMFNNNDLNRTSPFDRANPSAEHIARHIGDSLSEALDQSLAPHAFVHSVSVTEARGCEATYILARR